MFLLLPSYSEHLMEGVQLCNKQFGCSLQALSTLKAIPMLFALYKITLMIFMTAYLLLILRYLSHVMFKLSGYFHV